MSLEHKDRKSDDQASGITPSDVIGLVSKEQEENVKHPRRGLKALAAVAALSSAGVVIAGVLPHGGHKTVKTPRPSASAGPQKSPEGSIATDSTTTSTIVTKSTGKFNIGANLCSSDMTESIGTIFGGTVTCNPSEMNSNPPEPVNLFSENIQLNPVSDSSTTGYPLQNNNIPMKINVINYKYDNMETSNQLAQAFDGLTYTIEPTVNGETCAMGGPQNILFFCFVGKQAAIEIINSTGDSSVGPEQFRQTEKAVLDYMGA